MSDLPQEIDTSRPHPARMYDYYLGGKNHFAADRAAADKWIAATPSHVSAEHNQEMIGAAVRAYHEGGLAAQARDSDEFARLAFTGLELVPPGVVLASEWRPEGTRPRPTPEEVNGYAGVARKP